MVVSDLHGTTLCDEVPNGETVEAMNEVQDLITDDIGEHFTGSAADFFCYACGGVKYARIEFFKQIQEGL